MAAGTCKTNCFAVMDGAKAKHETVDIIQAQISKIRIRPIRPFTRSTDQAGRENVAKVRVGF